MCEEMNRAAARCLQPHHARSFFEAVFADPGGVMRRKERGRFELTRAPALLHDRDHFIGRSDPVRPRYRQLCVDKESIVSPRSLSAIRRISGGFTVEANLGRPLPTAHARQRHPQLDRWPFRIRCSDPGPRPRESSAAGPPDVQAGPLSRKP